MVFTSSPPAITGKLVAMSLVTWCLARNSRASLTFFLSYVGFCYLRLGASQALRRSRMTEPWYNECAVFALIHIISLPSLGLKYST
jgi:hypothetical protein